MNEVFMRKFILSALALATGSIAAPALAQDRSDLNSVNSEATAPDGTDAFGLEPYVAVMGGYASFDRNSVVSGIPNAINGRGRDGYLVEGIVGANVPLGAFFVGAEGSVAKGVDGDIDWQYGVAGRVGVRAGESGMIYAKAGYEWVNFTDGPVTGGRDFGDEVYGIGAEAGARDIGLAGLTGNSGARIRAEITTRDFESIRPMVGVVFHF
jgi:outer membrane immunogenic protein